MAQSIDRLHRNENTRAVANFGFDPMHLPQTGCREIPAWRRSSVITPMREVCTGSYTRQIVRQGLLNASAAIPFGTALRRQLLQQRYDSTTVQALLGV
jgi:hypothetical protein